MVLCVKVVHCGERERGGRKDHQLHSSSANTHLLLRRWDSDPERSAQSLGDRSVQHGWPQAQCAVRGDRRALMLTFSLTDWAGAFFFNLAWCPSAGAAGRSCSVWSWACWWRSWWPAAPDRSTTGGRQGRPATEDLTYILFWTSECCYFHTIKEEGIYYSVHESSEDTGANVQVDL